MHSEFIPFLSHEDPIVRSQAKQFINKEEKINKDIFSFWSNAVNNNSISGLLNYTKTMEMWVVNNMFNPKAMIVGSDLDFTSQHNKKYVEFFINKFRHNGLLAQSNNNIIYINKNCFFINMISLQQAINSIYRNLRSFGVFSKKDYKVVFGEEYWGNSFDITIDEKIYLHTLKYIYTNSYYPRENYQSYLKNCKFIIS